METFRKRQKALQRQERQKEKAAKRMERKLNPLGAPTEDAPEAQAEEKPADEPASGERL